MQARSKEVQGEGQMTQPGDPGNARWRWRLNDERTTRRRAVLSGWGGEVPRRGGPRARAATTVMMTGDVDARASARAAR